MAFSTGSGLFLFLALLLFSTQINGRESYSFGKFQREYPKEQNPNNLQTNETSEQDDQNPPFMPETENGYGLYGQETTYSNNEDQFKNNKYDENVNYDDSFSTPSLSQTQESYKTYGDNYPKTTESYDENNKDSSFYENSNGYGPEKREKEAYKGYRNNVERQRMSDKTNYENNKDSSYYETSSGYEPEKREKEAYKGYGNNVGRQGMSNTRFMANGKYYYDLDDDRNHGRFYQKHYYNYNPTNYNEDSSFKNPYSSKNMMNGGQSEMFGEGQGDQFNP